MPGTIREQPKVLVAFVGAHVINDFNAMILPAFLPAITDEFDLSYFQLGILGLAFTILSGVFQPFAGNYADREGKRRFVLIVGFLSAAFGFAAISASPSYVLIVVTSVLCGLGAAMYHPQATAILVREYPADRGRTLGVHGWGGSIGHFAAPALIAVTVTAFGWRQAMLLTAIPAVATAVMLRGTLSESDPNPGATIRGAISRDLINLALTFALLGMTLRGFLTFLPTLLVERGSSLTEAGVLTTFVLVIGMIAQPLGGTAFDRRGGRDVFFGASVGATAFLVFFAFTSGWLTLVAVAGVAFFVFALFPVSLAWASELAGEGQTGAATGVVFGISGLTSAIVPAALGAIADATDLTTALSLLIVTSIGAAIMARSLPAQTS